MKNILPSDSKMRERTRKQLIAYNRSFMTDVEDCSYHIEADGAMIAGIVAQRTLDLIEIEYLFVDEEYRGQGFGRALVDKVEEVAAQKGVKRILLNTYRFQAEDFYSKLGYRALLTIDPCFGDYSQTYFVKQLDESR